MKKKLLSLMLVLAMVLGMSTTVLAEGETTEAKPLASKEAPYSTLIKKVYTLEGSTDDQLYPAETLHFTSLPSTSNPDDGTANLTVADLVVTGNNNQLLSFTVPSFSKVGTYHFTISETTGATQGVTYTEGKINVSVLVTYDYADTDGDGYLMTAEVGITRGDDASKNDIFTNIYTLGSLEVTKTVTGNLADTSKKFDMTVTFTSDQVVLSTITGADEITEDEWEYNETTQVWTATSDTFSLAHGETATFNNIPADVTYVVTESSKYSSDTNKNGENGYDAPVYDYKDDAKKINGNDADIVNVTNNKGTEVDTGLILNNLPYILVLAAIACAVVVLVRRKREF